MYALVDCNNFFVSCERLFRPELRDVPVAVLSNNDGCVVARSNEVKALGVPMGTPHFKAKDVLERHKAVLFSANFRLYGDMSSRVVQVLTAIAPQIEVYSVDESFLDLSELRIDDYEQWAKDVAAVVEKRTGIPVSVGVAPTKTLAKLAAEQAKKDANLKGGHAIIPPNDVAANSTEVEQMWLKDDLCSFPVEDIWGIGRRLAPMLRDFGVTTAWEFIQLPDAWIRKKMSIKGLQTAQEIRGLDCYGFAVPRDIAKMVSASRSFGSSLSQLHELEAAVSSLAFRAGYRLRRQSLNARTISIYLSGGKKATFSSKKASITFDYPLNDSAAIVSASIELLKDAYASGRDYKKAGVILQDITGSSEQQMPLLKPLDERTLTKIARKNTSIDSINDRWGSGTISYAISKTSDKWVSKRENVSPAYTTRWAEIPTIS